MPTASLRRPHRHTSRPSASAGARIDSESGALAIGLPGPNTEAKVIDEAGNELSPLELGQIAIRGPQITPGYWNDPAGTAGYDR